MKTSKHVDQQYRWTEAVISALKSLFSDARHFKFTQEEYLTRREKLTGPAWPKLTRESRGYVRGYERALGDAILREVIHVRRIVGKPETASAAKWDDMTEELRQACRDHDTESCLAWDEKGSHPYSPWAKE